MQKQKTEWKQNQAGGQILFHSTVLCVQRATSWDPDVTVYRCKAVLFYRQ